MFLRKSTASQEILLGPFVDSLDGDTAEVGLTIANTDIKIWKHGATTLADKNSGGATHISGGHYSAVLDATDTDTVGMLEVVVKVAGALAVRRAYQVVEGVVYDAMFAAAAVGYQVPIWAAANSTVNLSGTTIATLTGSVTVGTNSDKTGYSLTAGTGLGNQTADITGSLSGAVGSVTAAITLPSIPANWITAAGIATDAGAEIADAVWDEARSGHVTAGTFGEALKTATGTITSATANTVTIPAPYDDGSAAGREIVIGGQGRALGTHAGSGVYAISPNWTSTPAPSSEFWLGGVVGGGTGLDAAGVRAAVGLASANLDTQLDAIPTAAENADAVWDEARAGHATAGTFGQGVASVQGNVTGSVGSVTGSVGSVVGAVGSVTGNVDGSVGSVVGSVASVTGNVGGNVVGSVASVTAGVTVADKTGFKLASDGLDTIVIETGVNARQAMSPILAAAAGVLSGATGEAGTIVVKGGNVATTRISATVDAFGNREVVTLTLPS